MSDCAHSLMLEENGEDCCVKCGKRAIHIYADKLERDNAVMLEALKEISTTTDYVQSQSTGVKQYFDTESSNIARVALAKVKPHTGAGNGKT